MKILFPFVGDNIGGSHISSLSLVHDLNKKGIKTIVLTHKHGQLQSYLDSLNIPWILPPVSSWVVGRSSLRNRAALSNIRSMSNYLEKESVDIIHTNDPRMHITWSVPSSISHSKLIWHLRGSKHYKKNMRHFSGFADSIISISKYCMNTMPKSIMHRTYLVYNPVSSSPYENFNNAKSIREQYGLKKDIRLVGWFSNFLYRKKPFDFVQIANDVLKKYGNNVIFPMFGDTRDPCYTEVLKLIDDLGLSDNILIMGFKFPLERYIDECDVMLAPQTDEGFGRTLVEAMLVSTPVVAAADGGHLEIVKHNKNGLLVEPGNITEFSDAVVSLLNNPYKVKKITNNAFNEAKQKYSIERHTSEVMQVYENVILANKYGFLQCIGRTINDKIDFLNKTDRNM